ncbi:hypothetical protein BLOT_010422 [Blomia tropicalis]|nr:hypothetical protein BLOT_010422 [Blomia tropicalis]
MLMMMGDDVDNIFKSLTHTLTRLRKSNDPTKPEYYAVESMILEKRKECSKIQDISTLHITHIISMANIETYQNDATRSN